MGEITIVGLGPGSFGLITIETLEKLKTAETLLLRTAKHPTVAEIVKRGIPFTSYDSIYEEKESFEEIYMAIAHECIKQAVMGKKVVYAVPGSPLVAEKTVVLIRSLAAEKNVPITILPGMSFLEVLYTRLAIDPIEGVTVLDAADLAAIPPELTTALVVTQVYNAYVASEAKLVLMENYPDDFEVVVVKNLGLPDEQLLTVPLFELDRVPGIDHLTSVYVPQRPAVSQSFSLEPILSVMAKLRSKEGCVWDIEQTHPSLRRYMVEEVYEVLEAIDLENGDDLCEELGDLLLQIVFHARIAEESKIFSMQDVIDTVTEKMVRRHPHVFGDIKVRDAGEVVLNWDAIKKQEHGHDRPSVLDGIPKELPSLMRAYKLQAKASKVGFDWDCIEPIWDKIYEELTELKEACAEGQAADIEAELGDVLFSVVNLARFLKIDGEVALNTTNNKFRRRFMYIENKVKEKGHNWEKMSLEELDLLWKEAKKHKI
ncbi:nucleoside triphosphate pyrophosphohydrolase [Pelosinus sp. IPA-1]|uniref:nucleoside triphosphate pyrophosphohydrolase n=1 Tax=Pelosinus sp. IPA-1 TaxID=3029569 RepID=UPI0024362783|nr:nucleoside triphosphate pyrophosphohydrolase [Pelosinus sp. IPA-1]GMA99094.1 nucleoside triphosphate pyrophosphohydrolase [Pelosinus sp. IPA-1]